MKMHNRNKTISGLATYTVAGSFISMTLLSGLALSSSFVSADDVVDQINIKVPISCTLSGTGMNTHNAEIANGQSNSAIGETTIKAFCNDKNGFAVYAVGYTDEEVGKNVLTNASLGSTSDIATGTATSGDNSNWAMKLSTVTSPTPTYPISIENSFDSFHNVPTEYTMVAKRNSGTDIDESAEGSTLKTTYQAYISKTQPAGTYSGKVKYTLVHPNDVGIPQNTMLDTGPNVCTKMKTLAAGQETSRSTLTSDIKAVRMADSLPAGFTPSEANTVSDPILSSHPIYIFFDNTNDAGIMYFYSGGYQVVMNPNSASMFYGNLALADISGLAKWDSSNVTTLQASFGDDVALTNLDALSNWDTAKLENLIGTFGMQPTTYYTGGYRSQLSNISALANWDTSNVKNMQSLFYDLSALSDISALYFWDVSNVTDMRQMFSGTIISNVDALTDWNVSEVENMYLMFGIGSSEYNNGLRSQLVDISGLADWDTGSVTTMRAMFQYADKLTNLNALANWDVSSVTNMRAMFQNTTGLIDATSIKDWNVTAVTATAGSGSSSNNNFYNMFYGSPATLVPFTLRSGTWNSSGTYVPSS